MDRIKSLVEKEYGIKVDSIEKMKNVYKIQSSDEIFSLKKIKYEFPHFLFIISAMKHLENNEFDRILPFIETISGKAYVVLDDGFAYLNKWINARVSNYENPIEMAEAAVKLSELHLCSRGFEVKKTMKPRIGWMKWVETFNTRLDEIQDFKKRIEVKEERTFFDDTYYNSIEQGIRIGRAAIDMLERSRYKEVMEKEMTFKGFCHHDYAHHNILIDNNNDMHIIDFDYCILDTHLHDLCSLMIRVMKNEKWDIDTAKFIIESYSLKYKVKQEEIPIMAGFIMFPQELWQIGIQYYWENQKWDEDFFEKKLLKIIEDMEPRYDFAKELELLNYGG
ncbi:CotS family spore coat protein [Clostridium cadaveris]|uniref:CotS family spore coat protein n=1 Tax=Clostridium cadaveris TaxID=1529 RepID=UPI0039933E44